jgi:WD40 repeat protein
MYIARILRSPSTREPLLYRLVGQNDSHMEYRGALGGYMMTAYGLTFTIQTSECISSTMAHTDFVKTLLVIPWLNILVSGGSDRQINIWDLAPLRDSSRSASDSTKSLRKLKTVKEHTRPVEALALAEPGSLGCAPNEAIFFSADSMGVIRSWHVKRDQPDAEGESSLDTRASGVTVVMKDVFEGHHTSVPELLVGEGGLWSGKLGRQTYHATAIPDRALRLSSLGRQPSPLPPYSSKPTATRSDAHRPSRLRKIPPSPPHDFPSDSASPTHRLGRRRYPRIRRFRYS